MFVWEKIRIWIQSVLFAEATVLDGSEDDAFKFGALEGFEEIVDGAAAEGAGDDVDVVDGGEHDDGDAGVVGAEMVEEGESVGAGHHDVGEDEVVVGVLLEASDGVFGAFSGVDGVSAAGEKGCCDCSHGFFVVDYQDSFLRHGWILSRSDGVM